MNGAKHRFSLILTCLLLTGLTVVYPFLLYTDNAFVTKWREWYIETAMGTMTHQWLATSFIPHDMIEKVMAKRYLMNQKQAGAESFWDFTLDTDGEEQAISPKARFYKLYSELDETEFESFLDENPDIKEQGYEGFEFDFIDDATRKGYDTGLKTCEGLGDYGSYVSEIVSRYDAVLGINASGFADYEGNGTGGLPYGFLKSEGNEIQGAVGNGWKIIGFDESNHLQVGEFSDTSGLRDAVEFHPALIINGQNLVAGTGLNDQQPRTAIGQAKDGTVLMLVIDGRQFHSFGISIERCGEIMGEYGAYQASMLDGGSSSVMVYKGREITSPTTLSQNEEGRTLPDAFLIR